MNATTVAIAGGEVGALEPQRCARCRSTGAGGAARCGRSRAGCACGSAVDRLVALHRGRESSQSTVHDGERHQAWRAAIRCAGRPAAEEVEPVGERARSRARRTGSTARRPGR